MTKTFRWMHLWMCCFALFTGQLVRARRRRCPKKD